MHAFMSEIHVGENISFRALVHTGPLSPEDLRVELYAGRLNADGDIEEPQIFEMKPGNRSEDGYVYETNAIPCCGSGRHGYTARVLPHHPDLKNSYSPRLITWA